MKSLVTLLIAMTMLISFNSLGIAGPGHGHDDAGDHHGHKIVGAIEKIEGPFVTVKDKKGKSHKFHVNKSTHTKGAVKIGSKVEVESTDNGHALSMHALK